MNFIFSSPSCRQRPLAWAESPHPAPAHQVLGKPPTAAQAACLQRGSFPLLSILFGTPVPLLALAESLLIYSWCHMKSEAGTAPPAPCSPTPTQDSPAPLAAPSAAPWVPAIVEDVSTSKPKLNAKVHRRFLFPSAFLSFSLFLKQTESKAAV